jgi:hypothetical protein
MQPASTGSAYMAQVTMAPQVGVDYRENIYAQLISPLIAGQDYDVHLMVSWTDNSQYATNNIGVKFSMDTIFPIDGVAQVYSSAVINDTQNWTEISGSFTAEVAYEYIAVGNFLTDDETESAYDCPSCTFNQHAYYIDDVCVVPKHGNGECSLAMAVNELHMASGGMRIVPTMLGLNVQFAQPLPQKAVLTVFDMQGRSLETVVVARGSMTQSLSMDAIAPGAYMVNVNVAGELWTRRFVNVR